ncbi:unnamed protein product [Sphagnum balticum]
MGGLAVDHFSFRLRHRTGVDAFEQRYRLNRVESVEALPDSLLDRLQINVVLHVKVLERGHHRHAVHHKHSKRENIALLEVQTEIPLPTSAAAYLLAISLSSSGE